MEELRANLINYIRRKFSNIDDIYNMSEDIVNEAWLKATREEHMNFGYLSTVCVRLAYRLYRNKQNLPLDIIDLYISEDDIVDQIISHEMAREVLNSLNTLREIEKKIVLMRYYEDCSFAEISKKTNINLNTVLTMHRRALEKLRPRLGKILEFEWEEY